jgi:4'-phosphopantetheinyl transferase
MQMNKNDLHLWPVHIDTHRGRCDYFFDFLDEEEKNRALRFRFDKDRVNFIVAHGMLRAILSSYLACEPASLVFEWGEHKKPFVKNKIHLQFNLSHSHEMAIVAVTLNDAIGVDVERVREKEDLDDIVQRFFSRDEIDEYFSLPANQRLRAFYNGWSRKEAFIKATGKGLFQELKSFSVSMAPGKLTKVISIEKDHAALWQLHSIEISADYAAAVCWRGAIKKIVIKTEWI